MINKIQYVSYDEYENEKQLFLKKYGYVQCYTSELKNNVYFKQYYTGSQKLWYERVETYCEVELKGWDDHHKCNVRKKVQCTKIEFWNDENPETKIYLEIY